MAIRWLLANLLSHLRFHQKSPGEVWQRYLQQWDQAPQRSILEGFSQVATLLGKVLTSTTCLGHLSSVKELLLVLPTTNLSQETPVVHDAPAAEASPVHASEADPASVLGAGERNWRIQFGGAAPELTLSPSFPLQMLIRRLAAFNQMARLGKFKQAAIIYRDIQHSIEHFDPRVYLPSLFGEYFSNIIAHGAKLSESLKTSDDITADALMELYRIDIELFMAAKT
jgi:hypothetical protein